VRNSAGVGLDLHALAPEAPEGADRYDYSYSEQEIRDLLGQWEAMEGPLGQVYAFFNNCHRGQAARNAEAMRRVLGQI